MTIISNTFALACRHLLSKYTISTLQSIDITDNQYDYQCILKFSRFRLANHIYITPPQTKFFDKQSVQVFRYH